MPTEYQYSSAPLPIKPTRKYRNEEEGVPLNLLQDPRVIKGSTHKLARQLAVAKKTSASSLLLSKSQTMPSPQAAVQRGEGGGGGEDDDQYFSNASHQPTYQFEVNPFVSPEIDIFTYLTDQQSKPPPNQDGSSQTDVFQIRPPTPEYVPRKTGVDSSTQVEDVTELFNFDKEVEPLLQVIVEKTLQQALFEVRSEAELQRLYESVDYFKAETAKEEEWVREKMKEAKIEQKLKEEELKKRQKAIQLQDRVRTLVAGLQTSRQIVPDMFESISKELFSKGLWKCGRKELVREEVIVPMGTAVRRRVAAHLTAQEILEELLLSADTRYRNDCICTKRKPRTMQLTVIVRPESMSGGPSDGNDEDGGGARPSGGGSLTIGPLAVGERDTLQQLTQRVKTELRARSCNAEVNLKKYFMAMVGGTDIAEDGALLNFKLPENVNFVV